MTQSTLAAEIMDDLPCLNRSILDPDRYINISIWNRYDEVTFLRVFLPTIVMTAKCFSILWLTIGPVFNILSFIIWSSRFQRQRSTSAVYLSALSLVDFVLIMCLYNYYAVRHWGLHGITHYPGVCQIYMCVNKFTQTYSTILVFGFTLERYIAICFPFKRHRLCTERRAYLALLILGLICLVPTIFEGTLWEFDQNLQTCKMRSWVEEESVNSALLSAEVIFQTIVPLAALFFNILVICEMKRLVQDRSRVKVDWRQGLCWVKRTQRAMSFGGKRSFFGKTRMSKSPSGNPTENGNVHADQSAHSEETSNFISTTIMLIILSFYLIACAIPASAVYLAQFKWIPPVDCLTDEGFKADPEWQTYLNKVKMKESIEFLCTSHYACNFLIYFITYKGFRKQAMMLFKCQLKRFRSLSLKKANNIKFPRRTQPRMLDGKVISRQGEQQQLVPDSPWNWIGSFSIETCTETTVQFCHDFSHFT